MRIALIAVLCLATACPRAADDPPATDPPADPLTPQPPTLTPPLPETARAPSIPPKARPGHDLTYTLRFPAPHTHHVDIEAVFPTIRPPTAAGDDAVEIFIPVWAPGSYLVREFSRHIEGLAAVAPDGQALAVTKVSKNRWRVAAGSASHFVVRYRVYSRELTVRTNFIDDSVAILNGAATFLTVAGGESRGHAVAIALPQQWSQSTTGLAPHPDGAPHHYLAADYDTLVDSPIVLGNPDTHTFAVDGVSHYIATFGGGTLWDGDRTAADIEKIVRAQIAFWGQIPYGDYVFLSVLTGGGGGLEHKNSTLMLGNPWRTRKRTSYVRWLGLASHEFFHTWNGKRLRPLPLGPFDYDREVYTPSLWIVEGLTAYYDDLLLRRAGLIDDQEYLTLLSNQIESVETTPGRRVQSLARSSFDAWIKFYRRDENSVNSSISYYRKGAVVGFLLDMAIRSASAGQRSLDDVMRLAYQRYAGARGYTEVQFRQVASEVAGRSLDDFFARYVDGTDDLDYRPALSYLGLRRTPNAPAERDGSADDESPGWLGASTAHEDGRLVVTEVPRETPAHEAGINVGDEILATDDYRVPVDGLTSRLSYYRPGDRVTLLISRHDKVQLLQVTLGKEPVQGWNIEVDPAQTSEHSARRAAWLAGPR